MLRYLVRRVLGAIPVLLVASFLVFVLVRATYDPLTKFRHQKDSARVLAEQREALGLNHPLIVQWWNWLTAFLRGDMGTSSRTRDSVSSMISKALWPSIQLLFWATILAVTIALLLSVYSAVKQYSVGDYVFTGLAYVGIVMPAFWFALIAIGLLVTGPVKWFNLNEPIFYSIGLHSEGMSGLNLDYFRHLALPVLTLIVTSVAEWSRFGRASMLEVLNADYVRASRAKGVPRRKVVYKHALRNALIPFVTVTVLDTAFLIGGVIITEEIFSIPGMGQGFLAALGAGDAPFLLAWFMISAIAVILFNLFADVFYVVLDPPDPTDMTFAPSVQTKSVDESALERGEPVPRSNWQLFRRRFFRHKLAWISLAILTILIIACFGAKWLAPYPQGHQDFFVSGESPSWAHPFGTDDLGRDQLSEIMYAGQISLMIGFFVALLSTLVGVTVGALAAYFGKVTDQGLSAVTDLFLILPELAVLAVAIEMFGNSSTSIILVLAALGWMSMARVIRGQVLSLKQKEFVEAARASGATTNRIVIRHILPNCVGTIMVNATLAVAGAVGAEAALSFLGRGIQPPQNSWGRMLADTQAYTSNPDKFYLVFFPGFMLVLTLLAVNFLGDALRDAFDPQSAH